MQSNPNKPNHLTGEDPWTEPSEWFSYRCRSCNHTGWVEDIGVDSFPPEKHGGVPILQCPECGGDWACDTSIPTKRSFSQPD